MLTASMILEYIKGNLGYDTNIIELTDDFIITWLQNHIIREFSDYCPEKAFVGFKPHEAERVPNTNNQFYFNDPEGRDIYSVLEMIDNTSLLGGHPLMGVSHMMQIPDFLVSAITSNMAKRFSMTSHIYEFIDPNIIRISGFIPTFVVIVYEREHAKNFSSIPKEYHSDFLDLCLGEIMKLIGVRRKQFSNLSTPYGEINIDLDIEDKGQALKDKVHENIDQIVQDLTLDVF